MKKRSKSAERAHDFESEAELCSHFMDVARGLGWRVFPETADFDLLLVATERTPGAHFRPGDQFGIQAKLYANFDVLYQALPKKKLHPTHKVTGPRFYGVLVPVPMYPFSCVAEAAGISVLSPNFPKKPQGWSTKGIQVRDDFGLGRHASHFFPHEGLEPCWVPEVEVDMPAGVAGPKQLTPWKMGAVKLCILALQRGYLTTKDFADHKISMTRWFQRGWIRTGDWVKHEGKRMKSYILVEENKPPHLLYPEVVEALAAAGLA